MKPDRPITARGIELKDLQQLLRLIETAWRVQLRISPVEFRDKLGKGPAFLAEDSLGVRGFMMIEPYQDEVAVIVGAGLRDSWNVRSMVDLLLPHIEAAALARNMRAIVHIGNFGWLVDELQPRGFETREWIVTFERIGRELPPPPDRESAIIRTAHYNDLAALSALDNLAFEHIWHQSLGNFREALARAISFAVALVDDKIVAYEWCEIYQQHGHLTRLAVHPDYQGRGIGAQLLYRAIEDALNAGAGLITLNTQENNRRSQALYRRFGFVNTHERTPIMWKTLASK